MNFIKVFNEIAKRTLPLYQKYRNDIKSLNIEVKNDKTLLTQADTEIQKIVIDTILKHDCNANFVAEEEEIKRLDPNNMYTWVVDPIDGTRPFTEIYNYEYCCAVGVLEKGMPIAAMIFMPEMGNDRTPILATALFETSRIFVNGTQYDYRKCKESNFASTTRESGSSSSKIEDYLVNSGVKIKNRTTSQSIDLLRTAIDISPYSDIGEGHFRLFYRQNQKVWDGVPGMCFNRIVGKAIVDFDGNNILPFSDSFLESVEPTTSSVIVAFPKDIDTVIRYK
ncbi:MAG: hypothetical protein LBC71_01250 [Oscillospiraceae bacterium]|jgi:3'(2'), 5'-bisphosphate nucleotidase|nr:hypothetical protein [Oscillospiraceae bacterium]